LELGWTKDLEREGKGNAKLNALVVAVEGKVFGFDNAAAAAVE
jgi:hypothetical protein